MLDLYFSPDPNPMKILIFLEEAGLDYRLLPVNLLEGEQHSSRFRALNPNGKVPVLIDGDCCIFDSTAILLYLAQKTGKLGGTESDRPNLLSWLMFIASGLGPFAGQAAHFRHFSPQAVSYANDRYTFEANRHYNVLEHRLDSSPFLGGQDYSIADISAWPWLALLPFILGDDAWSARPNLHRLMSSIASRPAVERALAVKQANENQGEIDERARTALFPHLPAGAEVAS